jgi:phosphoglycerate kinase
MIHINDYNFKGKKALIRVDFNVPLNDKMEVTDDTRIRAAIPTIKKVLNDGGAAILMSHFGRPKNGPEEKYSLQHILPTVSNLLGLEVKFAPNCIDAEAVIAAGTLLAGEVLLLENTRFDPEEEEGDKVYASELALLGNVYINDAFGSAHRAHASTCTIAENFTPENKMFGYLMDAEIAAADKVLKNAAHPFTAILGGAKVSDKIEMIDNLLNIANNIIIGGGMAYTFFKAQGGKIGSSLCEDEKLDLAKELLAKAKKKGVTIILPLDSTIADKFDAAANTQQADNMNIPDGWMGLDIGEKAIAAFNEVISQSKTILWNGPMGVFEMEKFENGTRAVALAIAEATNKGAYSLIGGGDSVAAINKFHLADKVSYVSTGGGAMLEYFEGKELPGIKAIKG